MIGDGVLYNFLYTVTVNIIDILKKIQFFFISLMAQLYPLPLPSLLISLHIYNR